MADELVQLSMNHMPIQQQSSILHQNHLKLSVVNMNFFSILFWKIFGVYCWQMLSKQPCQSNKRRLMEQIGIPEPGKKIRNIYLYKVNK